MKKFLFLLMVILFSVASCTVEEITQAQTDETKATISTERIESSYEIDPEKIKPPRGG
ncbi:hypothetical protein V3Q77_08345 [Flavobacterium davisii]|uniref:Secreted protein n=1 Tax=Flavobacterium davisii TaxID=2906077 RepID=A0ABW8PPN1_9FLAO